MDRNAWKSYSRTMNSPKNQGLTPAEYERRARALARKLKI